MKPPILKVNSPRCPRGSMINNAVCILLVTIFSYIFSALKIIMSLFLLLVALKSACTEDGNPLFPKMGADPLRKETATYFAYMFSFSFATEVVHIVIFGCFMRYGYLILFHRVIECVIVIFLLTVSLVHPLFAAYLVILLIDGLFKIFLLRSPEHYQGLCNFWNNDIPPDISLTSIGI